MVSAVSSRSMECRWAASQHLEQHLSGNAGVPPGVPHSQSGVVSTTRRMMRLCCVSLCADSIAITPLPHALCWTSRELPGKVQLTFGLLQCSASHSDPLHSTLDRCCLQSCSRCMCCHAASGCKIVIMATPGLEAELALRTSAQAVINLRTQVDEASLLGATEQEQEAEPPVATSQSQ